LGRGSGPDATRLFCQSSMGVVTAGAIALVPRPEFSGYVYASFRGAALPAVVDQVARIRREHVVDRIFYFSEMQIDAQSRGLPDFTLLGPLLGRRRLVHEALAIVRESLESVPGCQALRTGEVAALEPGDPLYHRGRAFIGIPSCEPLRARFGTTTCALDETSHNGWSVLQTVLPLTGRAVREALVILGEGVLLHGGRVQPHISTVSSRSLNLMTMIWFERSPGGIERMRMLRDHLQAELVAHGFHPSRESIDMLHAAKAGVVRDEALARIKVALDPHGIVAPGRYV
jgi:4-cresol dehydrogenase (hydroxylating) flavoprotein subunit